MRIMRENTPSSIFAAAHPEMKDGTRPALLFHAKRLLIRARGNDAPAIACKARGTPRNHAPLADKGEARSCDIPQRRPGTAPAGSPLVGLGQRDWNGVLTRNLGPSSIPSLSDGVMLGTAWIDRPVDTQGCAPCFHVLLSGAWMCSHARAICDNQASALAPWARPENWPPSWSPTSSAIRGWPEATRIES